MKKLFITFLLLICTTIFSFAQHLKFNSVEMTGTKEEFIENVQNLYPNENIKMDEDAFFIRNILDNDWNTFIIYTNDDNEISSISTYCTSKNDIMDSADIVLSIQEEYKDDIISSTGKVGERCMFFTNTGIIVVDVRQLYENKYVIPIVYFDRQNNPQFEQIYQNLDK